MAKLPRCCHKDMFDTDDEGNVRIGSRGKLVRLDCVALNDSDFLKYKAERICGTLECPFYKPRTYLIRRGDRFYYTDGTEYFV